MGAKRDDIAAALSMPLGTFLSLLNRIRAIGLPAFEDRRTKTSAFKPPADSQPFNPIMTRETENVVIDFGDQRIIRIPSANITQLKTFLLTLLENDLLTSAEVAQALGYSADHTIRLAHRLYQQDATCLQDKRRGQLVDYRMTPEVKAELIQQFVLNIVSEGHTSGRQIAAELDQRCQVQVSERTVRQHLINLGLPSIKNSLPKLLLAVKKTPEHNSK